MEQNINFQLNGKKTTIWIDPTETLLWVLRNNFDLTGTKFGCGIGFCGSCTILINNEPLRSCMLSMGDIDGKKITTIEGLSKNGQLHPVQHAFVEHDALQCGYCTPGMIMNATGLLLKNASPSTQEIKEGMENNLCRCGAHIRIVEAVHTASKIIKNNKKS
ncbi:MAG: (2Fe-2S)-binding protein [Flavobacteriaceae bacterium]|jgi:carbon-monoxide dehydrogenase small subunit|nr:(2Fe-2S)-binding protein [Flavobacteriaceae bacterium]